MLNSDILLKGIKMNLKKLSHFLKSSPHNPFFAFAKIDGVIRPCSFKDGNLNGLTEIALAAEVLEDEFAYKNWESFIDSIAIENENEVSLEDAVSEMDTTEDADCQNDLTDSGDQIEKQNKRGRPPKNK